MTLTEIVYEKQDEKTGTQAVSKSDVVDAMTEKYNNRVQYYTLTGWNLKESTGTSSRFESPTQVCLLTLKE